MCVFSSFGEKLVTSIMKKIFVCILFLIVLFSCRKSFQTSIISKNEYATNFSIQTQDNQVTIISAGNCVVFPEDYKSKRCVITTTSASAYIDALGEINSIVGVCSPHYFYNPKIKEKIKNQSIEDIGNDATLNFEKILALQPDLIISGHNSTYEKILNQLSKQGIKILYVEEFMELHPLGKTEYLKLFGTVFKQYHKADSLYTFVKKNYEILKEKAARATTKPTVFTGIMYGDSWYMAGGKSFLATLFKDAGAHYLWQDNKKSGSIPMTFEEVLSKAKNAELWIGTSNFKSKKDLLNGHSNYAWFEAYKSGNVYALNNRENQLQANDYYEYGSIYADKVLSDLIKIIHPEIIPEYELTYLRKLE